MNQTKPPSSPNTGNQAPGKGGGPTPSNKITIYVNGRPRHPDQPTATYADIVELAFPGANNGADVLYTVTYANGHPPRTEGSLLEGQTIKLKDGMKFNVAKTDRS